MARMRDGSGGVGQGDGAGFPVCRACGEGELVPLSDYGGQGAAVLYKAWVCTAPDCGFNLKIRNGDVLLNEPVHDAEGAAEEAQPRRERLSAPPPPAPYPARRPVPVPVPAGVNGTRGGR